MNTDSGLDDLIKVLVIHHQFETIHPFLDGNNSLMGKAAYKCCIAREKVIKTPSLCLSFYLKRERNHRILRQNQQ